MKPSFDDIKGITFATAYNWSIEITDSSGATIDTMKCLTAISVTEDVGIIEEKSFKIGPVSLNIPESVGQRTINITFLDNEFLKTFDYLNQWYGKFFSYESGEVGLINEVARKIKITQLFTDGTIVGEREYLVYPFGTLQYKGTSEAELFTVTATLRVLEFNL